MANELNLTEVQRRYLDWLCTPPSERQPVSKNKFAELVGKSARTLRDWEAKPVFRDEWERRAKDVQGSPERHQRVLDTLFQKAADGDVQAAKLWLTALEKIAPPSLKVDQTVTSKKVLAELSDDELAELLASEAAVERARREAVL
jgi:hypothetical protein